MPVIEANKVGRPVLASDIPVIREVAGDAAVFVDPYDIEAMRRGFVRLMESEALRSECVEKRLGECETVRLHAHPKAMGGFVSTSDVG